MPALWPFALAGNSKVVAAGLIAAGVLDAADGFVARRLRQPTLAGARLDAVADSVLMLSVTAWLGILHPVLLTGDALLWLPVAALYATSAGLGWVAFRRLVDPRQLSGKVAGGMLYLFALVTLVTGAVATVLLVLALVALAISCLETIIIASQTIHARATVSRQRSQAPHAVNGVARSASPATSMATSTSPKASEIAP